MENITLQAHYDGNQIQLDEPFDLKPNTKLLVTVLQQEDPEAAEWMDFSAQQLARAYSDVEPEYTLSHTAVANQPEPLFDQKSKR